MPLYPEGFRQVSVASGPATIFARIGGTGPALLLLHGFPQTHAMWHKVVPQLMRRFTCVAPDLRGYGFSSCPPNDRSNFAYSKRVMAQDMIRLMSSLGHERFAVVGHDRGGRVAYRLALDEPGRVRALALLDIISTYHMWQAFDAQFAMKVYHWSFLAQPHPLPEMLIEQAPVAFLDYTLASWTKARNLSAFDEEALAEYRLHYATPEHIHASCNDYRAGWTCDLEADQSSRAAGQRIGCPVLVIWGEAGIPAETSAMLDSWREWAAHAGGQAIDSGHFLAEENPQAMLDVLMPFLEDTAGSMIRRFDRQAEFAGTRALEGSQDIDPRRLAGYLARTIVGFAGPAVIEQFRGGQSNPTYLVAAKSGTYVVRRKPTGRLLKSAHAVEREYRVTKALQGAGFPVAAPLALCTDESVIGAAFYVMEFVPGRIFWEPHAPGLDAAGREQLFHSLNATMARLHGLDVTVLGLADFGRPEGYVRRQIRRWSEQYAQSCTAQIAEMDRLMAWLPDAAPEQTQACLIHGDFRLDNCIVDPGEPRIAAVLDWELSTIGDPIADFTYHIMQWHMPASPDGGGVGSLAGCESKAPGLPQLEDYIAEYCRRRKLANLPNLDIYLAYNFFRLAAIFQGIAGRVREGTAVNPNAARLARQVRPMAERAWQFAKAAGA